MMAGTDMIRVELLLLGSEWRRLKATIIAAVQGVPLQARDIRAWYTYSHMGPCLQNLAGGGSRALRRVLAAAWWGIICGRYGGNSGAAGARRRARQGG